MNRTNFEHLCYALAMQAAIGWLTGNWWVGAAAGAFFFLGREHAQVEYKYIQQNGGRRHETPIAPELAACHPGLWSRDAILDFAIPAVGVVALGVIAG
jgi:hypothetical protein